MAEMVSIYQFLQIHLARCFVCVEARTLSKITDTMPGASCVLFTLSFYDYELDADGNEAIVR
jgi:hypothetical protein